MYLAFQEESHLLITRSIPDQAFVAARLVSFTDERIELAKSIRAAP